jgi:glycosyltransferase involved in cell wall biosynthesis
VVEIPALRRVGLNLVFLLPGMGGMEAYARRLVPGLLELRPELELMLFVKQQTQPILARETWAHAVEFVTHPFLGRRFTSALSELTMLNRLATDRGLHLLHNLGMTSPLKASVTNVITVPDLIWWHHPDSLSRTTTVLWRALVPPLARRADRILTFSQASRDDIVDLLRVPANVVDVIPLAAGLEPRVEPVSESLLRAQLELGDGPVVLAVSTKIRHKNVLRLVQAMQSVVDAVPKAVLVVPGRPTAYEHVLAEEVQRLGLEANVRLPAWLAAEELEALYRHAACFVCPSLREGFGLPVLEAMARGVPVACSNTSSLPEVAGDAARYFDPRNVEEIASAVIELLQDEGLRGRLAAAGRAQERRFTWRATAEATLSSYERAYAGRSVETK